VGRTFFRFVTNHAFDRRIVDRRTDRRTDGQHSHGYTVRCVTCSRTVKIRNLKKIRPLARINEKTSVVTKCLRRWILVVL